MFWRPLWLPQHLCSRPSPTFILETSIKCLSRILTEHCKCSTRLIFRVTNCNPRLPHLRHPPAKGRGTLEPHPQVEEACNSPAAPDLVYGKPQPALLWCTWPWHLGFFCLELSSVFSSCFLAYNYQYFLNCLQWENSTFRNRKNYQNLFWKIHYHLATALLPGWARSRFRIIPPNSQTWESWSCLAWEIKNTHAQATDRLGKKHLQVTNLIQDVCV